MSDRDVVYGFYREHAFLSNFFPSPIDIDGLTYPTVEHAFAAAKSESIFDKRLIAAIITPGRAKRAGRRVTLRADGEDVKIGVMLDLVRRKFRAHPELAAALLDTGSADLVESNTWGDAFWGVNQATGEGRNELGKALVLIRSELAHRG